MFACGGLQDPFEDPLEAFGIRTVEDPGNRNRRIENPKLESKIKSSMVTVLNMILATSELQVFGWVGVQVLGSRNRMIETPKIENPKIQNPGTGVPPPGITSLAMKISQVFFAIFFLTTILKSYLIILIITIIK